MRGSSAASEAFFDLLHASDGSSAALERAGAVEVLRVRDGRGRLLFEHRPAEGRSVVHAPEGDLDFEVGGRVRVRAAGIEVSVDEGRLVARATTAVVRHAQQTFETLETGVGRLVERAREAYREAEDLAETRAGRLRLVASKTLHALAERALIKAREDVKVKGEKIYVG